MTVEYNTFNLGWIVRLGTTLLISEGYNNIKAFILCAFTDFITN